MSAEQNHQGKVSREIIHDHILLLGLDRAEKYNAFDSHLIHALADELTAYEADDNLRCVVIFAHGKHFTAGLDLMELQPKLKDGVFNFDDQTINPWGIKGKQRTKPMVVAVHGYCYTAGIELMLNADVVIASEQTEFAQMEVQRGIMPFGGATVRFVQAAGWQKAMPYLLTGKKFDSQTALDLNLISEIAQDGEQLERAIEMAQEISAAAPLAVKALIAAATEAQLHGQQYAFDRMNSYLPALFASQDAMEGVMAMMQKRPPKFQGK